MFKKIMALATLVCAVPALANAWTLSTWAKSGGGNITVTYGGNASNYTSVSGLKFKTYTTQAANPHNVVPVSVTANTGYYISTLNVNGTVTTGTATSPVAPYSANITGPGAYNVYATFRPLPISITATAGAGGTISPAIVNNVYYGQTLVQKIKFTATPNPGFTASIVAPGCTIVNPTAANVAATAIITAGTVMTQPIVVTASFVGVAANAGAPQTIVGPGSKITLTSASLGATTYAWTQTSGPAVTLNAPTTATPYFTPTVNGTYTFNLSINGGASVASTQVFVVNSATAAAWNQCASCHNQNNVASGATYQTYTGVHQTLVTLTQANNVYANWSSSIHSRSTHAICSACHVGTNTGTHPGTVYSATVDPATFLTKVAGVNGTLAQGALFCTYCHNGAHPVPHATTGLDATQACANCHYTTGATYADAHTLNASNVNATLDNCTNCHTNGVLPTDVTSSCATCHVSSTPHTFQAVASADCVGCHNVAIDHVGSTYVSDNNGGVRAITGANGEFEATNRLNAVGGYRSHHIYNGAGVDPQNAQCIACHLEGKVGANRTVVLDPTYHMADAKVHLRSGNTAITPNVAWDPANPNHTDMDNFCMSCHNAAGAVSAYANISSALKGMTAIPGAVTLSAVNPFGDKLTNAYDQMVRPAVINVYDQFDPANTSHHAVRGKKYSGRTRITPDPRAVANAAVFTQYSGANLGDSHPNAKGVMTSYQIFGSYSSTSGCPSGNGPTYPGSRQTLYDAQLMVASYTTLNGSTLGDDSTLHCGDCHSVGQWAPGSAKAVVWNNMSTASGGSQIVATTIAVGAHGSKNEYMLRTSNGSDALHRQSSTGLSLTPGVLPAYRTYTNGTYVCYLCHVQENYGDNPNNVKPLNNGTAHSDNSNHGALGRGDCNGAKYTQTGKTGYARVNPVASAAGMGNLFGYTCGHCHSSGNQAFGGIHGSSKPGVGTYLTYSTCGLDVAGSSLAPNDLNKTAYQLNVVNRNSYRFMGGASIRYNGGNNPAKWEAQSLNGKHREGCYNLSATTDTTHLWNTTQPLVNGSAAIQNNSGNDSAIGATDYSSRMTQNSGTSGWGSCNHHQGSTTTGATTPTRGVQRPLVY